MHSISCVIFDIDGTLTRTNDLIFASFNHLAAKYLGRTFAPAEIVSHFGPPEEGAVAAVFGHDNVAGLMDELCEFYSTHHPAMAAVHTGIPPLLEFLKSKGILLAIFTGKGSRTTGITLRGLGIEHMFDMIVTGSDVVQHKPNPEGIQKVLDRFRLSPDEVIMVGDSMSDLVASRAAGIHMASVVWDSYDRDRVTQSNPHCLFHTVEEMDRWFRSTLN